MTPHSGIKGSPDSHVAYITHINPSACGPPEAQRGPGGGGGAPPRPLLLFSASKPHILCRLPIHNCCGSSWGVRPLSLPPPPSTACIPPGIANLRTMNSAVPFLPLRVPPSSPHLHATPPPRLLPGSVAPPPPQVILRTPGAGGKHRPGPSLPPPFPPFSETMTHNRTPIA